MFASFTADAQSFDVSLSASGNTDPGGTVTITMTVTCNDIHRCRLGGYPNPDADGMITVTGNATPSLFNIPQDINRFGFFTPGQSSYSNYTVSDTSYITDTDNQLFSTIGRWPVRSATDLDTVIAHRITWSNSDHTQGNCRTHG